MPADPQRVRELFLHAVGRLPPERWDAYLAEACGPDVELRQHAAHLLQVHREAGSFLEQPVAGVAATGAFTPSPEDGAAAVPPEAAGTTLGPYKLLEEIGEGGMGSVWMAQQTAPVKRLVALKVIKPGMDSKQVLARFEAERQALALMDHPHIAKVLDAGTTATGRPFFVMELVKGVPITRYCDEHRLTPRQRLELFVPVCQAVQHAHQKGIIHRDLKPSNVLVALYDGRPVPKVIDFGVAKAAGQPLTERTLVTGFGSVVGTLEYMSPEQAQLNQLDIDTRSDIYSLGVLLYELLTGGTPLDRKRLKEAALLEVLRLIREEEPPRPSMRLSESEETLPSISAQRQTEPAKLAKLMRGELDWIVMKALEKDRNRRYDTANGFAQDIERYLADEPVLACPPSATYRLGKFVRRHRVALTTSSALALAALLVVGSLGWAVRDRAARDEQAARERAAQRLLIEEGARRALDLSDEYLHKGKWHEARVEARRADSILASGPAPEELRQRTAERLADLDMVLRLEAIRTADPENAAGYPGAAADKTYTDLFREYGIDVERPDVEEVGRQIGRRAIRLELALALDSWAGLYMTGPQAAPAVWQRLLAMARAADPDEWRAAVRDALGRQDRKRLLELARRPQAAEQPAATVDVLALALWVVQERETAVALLQRAQNDYRDDFRINFSLASMLLSMNPPRAEDSIRFHQAALALRPKSPGLLNNLGMALQAGGRLDEALAAYRESVDRQPGWSGGHYNLGNALHDKGQLDEAIAAYHAALRLRKDFPDAYYNLGNALRAKGRSEEAIAAYREALATKQGFPTAYKAHYNLGLALQDKGRLDRAIAAYREALRLKKDFPEAHVNLGNALRAKGRTDEAIAEFRAALATKQRFPDAYKAHANLGNVLYAEGRLDEAIAAYREAIRLKKDYPAAHYSLGGALKAKGRLDEAIAAYREALRFRNDLPEAHVNLGNALKDRGRLDEAVAAYREALATKQRFPDAYKAHANLGNVLYAKGRLDEAIAAYREAIRLKKDYPAAHYNLGGALRAKGRLDEAIAAYRESIRLKKDYPEAHCNLADALKQKGEFRQALEELRRGHELGSKDPRWPYPSAQWVRQCERLVKLDAKLPQVLKGEAQPADAAERLDLAQMCQLPSKSLNAAAVRFYTDAFAREPKVADDLGAAHRYNAARAAALAGVGQGQDARNLDDKERARLRRQALDWLQADLRAWHRLLANGPAQVPPAAVAKRMRYWLADTAFAGLRGPEALAKLPDAEQQRWRELWDQVADALARALPRKPQKVSGAR
jgi:tetratricopeptide (TPR) repeat protein/serine/threonine protein kinase